MALTVERIVNGRWRQNCYVVSDASGRAVVIDPGDEMERISLYIRERRLRVRAILGTHAHHDHVGAVSELKSSLSVPFYLHTEDMPTLKHVNLYRKMFDGADPIQLPEVDEEMDLPEGSLELVGNGISYLHTPGHSPGSVCFMAEGHLFTGDTLFRGKVGRVDLPGGDPESLRISLGKLGVLNPDLRVHPGHGGPSVLGSELSKNGELAGTVS